MWRLGWEGATCGCTADVVASRLLVYVAAREEKKDSDGVWLSGLLLGQRGAWIGLPGARLS